MQRPIWKGYISFGLVNIPVILYSAEKKLDIHFKLVDSRDQARIRYMRVNEQTGEEVPWSEIAKGYEYDDHNFILLKDEDIKNISGERSKAINIECFINKDELNYTDFEKPYFVVPDKHGEKGYVILRESLKSTRKIGISKVVIHTRQYLAALIPYENALILNLLRYHQEVKKLSEFEFPSNNLKIYKVNPKEIEIAKQLIDSMTTKWHPEIYHDEFRESLEKWIEEKMYEEKPRVKKRRATASRKGNVINFVDLLKKSIETKKGTTPKKSTTKKRKK